MLTNLLRQIVVYVEVNLFGWCDMLHADPAIAVEIGVGTYVLMVVFVMVHRHH